MKPINKYIIVTPVMEELKTESGLLLSQTDAFAFRYKKATVVKPGTLVDTIKSGDVVYYDKAQAHEVIINDQSYVCSRS
jgi:co-chaperonin GroES (HSP10)